MEEEILDEASFELRTKLEQIWDIHKSYWYPLFDCKRDDLIAFDADYIENPEKLNDIILLLRKHGVEEIIEFLETDKIYKLELAKMYPYYSNKGGEGFWTSEKMDWIIYSSHEGTITIGGEWLINELKSLWVDWKSHTSWDTKN